MKSKEDLFHLIKALSRSEKRYFTIDAQKSGKKASKYLELFQLINAMDSYDEQRLKKKFPRHLASDKAYLYEAILRSMRDYRSAKSRSAQIREKVLDAKYLYERGLYDQCEERLQEARAMAEEMGDLLVLLEINQELRKLTHVLQREDYDQSLNLLARQKNEQVQSIHQEFRFHDLFDQLLARVVRHFQLHDPQDQAQLREAFPDKLLGPDTVPESPIARLRYYQANALYHQLLGHFDQVFRYYSEVVDWWDANPKYKGEEFYRYIMDMSNLLHACFYKDQYDAIPALLEKLEAEEPSSLHEQSILFQKTAIYRLMYHINLGVDKGLDQVVERIERGLGQFEIQVSSRSAIIFNVALLLFIHRRFEECMAWCGQIMEDRKSPYRQDIQTGTFLLNLMAAYNQEDVSRLDNTLRTTRRYLQKRELHQDPASFEMRVLEFIRRFSMDPLSRLRKSYESFRDYLQGIRQAGGRPPVLGLDVLFLYWVKGELNQRPVASFFREQQRQKAASKTDG